MQTKDDLPYWYIIRCMGVYYSVVAPFEEGELPAPPSNTKQCKARQIDRTFQQECELLCITLRPVSMLYMYLGYEVQGIHLHHFNKKMTQLLILWSIIYHRSRYRVLRHAYSP